MSAFDEAWALLKMPIVPGSVSRNYRAETRKDSKKGIERYSGAFDDPISGERLDMEGQFNPEKQELTSYIRNPTSPSWFPKASASQRARAKILPHDRGGRTHQDGGSDPQWSGLNVGVNDEYQKRGYGTGLYDFSAHILDRNKKQLIPSHTQTEDGERFWENRATKEGNWPVRDDL